MTPNQMRETIMKQHRTISIINHITEIILKVITERTRNKITPVIAKEEFSFVATLETTMQFSE